MSTPRESVPDNLTAVAGYVNQGYDLETARRLARFDQEYMRYLTPSEIEEYLALRKRIK